MQFPIVSHVGLLTVVVVGSGLTVVAGLAAGFDGVVDDPLSSASVSELHGLVPLHDELVGRLIRTDDADLTLGWDQFMVRGPGTTARMGMGEPTEFPAARPMPVPGLAAPMLMGIGVAALGFCRRSRGR